uniref:Flp pilus assembly protein TadD, contains TPR repeats n=1 Tax=Candidatus Kentrum sp. FW TaxID=2126338 RepID=A0A450TEH9_9GAMM|nr:MAG: Flp pilus assembly protein TadD, contains TPR repeats [Candidatus Kentron sp. FW]
MITHRSWAIGGLILLIGFGVPDIGMAQDGHSPPSGATVQETPRTLLPVPTPDLSRVEEAVKQHLEGAHTDLVSLQDNPDITKLELGEAYGRLGQIYHVHRLDDAARACYHNAGQLLEKDVRWPYLLGYLYQQRVQLSDAARSYRRTLELYANYSPAQLRLAQVLLGLNRIDEAEELLEQISNVPEFQGIAAFELGKAALRKGRHAKAVEWLTRAYAKHPEASKIHYPLAMAYRGLGNIEAARHHLRQRGDLEPVIPDPLVEELADLLSGKRTRQYHAMKAVWRRQFDIAAKEYRAILALDPADISARISLGRCLYLSGDMDSATREFSVALEQQPDHDKANYFLGRLFWEKGQKDIAVDHFLTTLETDPEHGGAHFFLAESLMQKGDFEKAASHFRKVSEVLPEDLVSRQREAMALLAMGEKMHRKARDRIVHALTIHPSDPVLTRQLVRVLAQSPDPAVQDGKRALILATDLFTRHNSIENAELVAMTHARLGQFDQAVVYQQAAVDTASRYYGPYGEFELLGRLQANLDAYLAGQSGGSSP